MKAILSFKLVLIVFCLAILSPGTKSQDEMKKPDPIKSATFDMLMGVWEAEPYEMMGSKWNETANHYMKHGQFMFVDIQGIDDKGQTYNGTVVIKPAMDGSFTGWAFDDWGSVTTYTGTVKGNKISLTGKSDWGSETREIEIDGSNMVHKCVFNMKGADGKETTSNHTFTYHKK